MGFFDKLENMLEETSERANNDFSKGYARAEKLSDAQIKEKMANARTFEKAGMIQAYKDRNGIE